MDKDIRLFHYVKGWNYFNSFDHILGPLEKQGWVDNEEKCPPGQELEQYQNAKVNGIEVLNSSGIRCAIWNTVAIEKAVSSYDGRRIDSLRAGGCILSLGLPPKRSKKSIYAIEPVYQHG